MRSDSYCVIPDRYRITVANDEERERMAYSLGKEVNKLSSEGNRTRDKIRSMLYELLTSPEGYASPTWMATLEKHIEEYNDVGMRFGKVIEQQDRLPERSEDA